MSSSSPKPLDSLLSLLPSFSESFPQTWLTPEFLSSLNLTQQQNFLSILSTMNPKELRTIFDNALNTEKESKSSASTSISPFPSSNILHLSSLSPTDISRYRSLGLQSILRGEVALIMMAGGAGTRLGYGGPKGIFDISLPSHRSIFHIHCNQIQKIIHLAREECGDMSRKVSLPLYVMTSVVTHDETVKYFSDNNNFSLDISFFQQSELPSFTLDGQMIRDRVDNISMSPNGNGGIFSSLLHSKTLSEMEKKNILHLHVFGVDNVLAKCGDPLFIGYAIESKSLCVNKVVEKENPHEKVGVMCLKDSHPSIVEYSELSKEMAEQTLSPSTTQLSYGSGNIAQHYFHISVVKEAAAVSLPYHVARKKILSVNGEVEGMKCEMFVFDVFERMSLPQIHCLSVRRAEEFSPVKNKNGADSPQTARRDFDKMSREIVEREGAVIRNEEEGSDSKSQNDNESNEYLFELDHSIPLSDVKKLKGKTISVSKRGIFVDKKFIENIE